jgi:hypothetical protein
LGSNQRRLKPTVLGETTNKPGQRPWGAPYHLFFAFLGLVETLVFRILVVLSEFPRADHDNCGEPAVLAGEVVLDRGRVGQEVAWVVDAADECGVAGVPWYRAAALLSAELPRRD